MCSVLSALAVKSKRFALNHSKAASRILNKSIKQIHLTVKCSMYSSVKCKSAVCFSLRTLRRTGTWMLCPTIMQELSSMSCLTSQDLTTSTPQQLWVPTISHLFLPAVLLSFQSNLIILLYKDCLQGCFYLNFALGIPNGSVLLLRGLEGIEYPPVNRELFKILFKSGLSVSMFFLIIEY